MLHLLVAGRLKTQFLGVWLLLQMWHCVTALMGAGRGIREGSVFFFSCDGDLGGRWRDELAVGCGQRSATYSCFILMCS